MSNTNVRSIEYYDTRMQQLRQDRSYIEPEIKNIIREIAVDTGDFDDPKFNRSIRKNPYYQKNINSIAPYSAKMLASLLVSHLTNPQQRWFFLDIGDGDGKVTREEQIWLKKCEDIMYENFQGSKLHQALHNVYYEGELFGTGVMVRRSMEGKGVYSPLTFGQYYMDQDAKGDVNVMARRFSMSLENLISTFGVENLPEKVRNRMNTGANRAELFNVIHFVEPNIGFLPDWENPYNKKYISTYYIEGEKRGKHGPMFLEQKGMDKFPYYVLRWDRYGTQVYGTGIGRFILGDVRMLQSNERDLAKASKKKVSPPLKGGPDMKKTAAKVGADEITYTNNPDGFTPLFNVNYDTRQAFENILRLEERIQKSFFLDTFFAMMTRQKTMSATEASAVDQEKLVVLGAVTDRARTEFLDKIVEDEFFYLWKAGKFPPIPESLAGKEMNVRYQSVLLQSMEMTDLVAIERYLQFTSQQAAIDPIAAMVPKTLEINELYASKLGVSKANLRSQQEVQAMFAAQQEGMEAQSNEVNSKAVLNQAKAAEALSKTNTTAENALTDLVG